MNHINFRGNRTQAVITIGSNVPAWVSDSVYIIIWSLPVLSKRTFQRNESSYSGDKSSIAYQKEHTKQV